MELIDLPITDKFNAISGVLVVIASYIFGAHWELFVSFLALNVIDYITGVMKSKMQHTESSSTGLRGIIKKFSYWVMIVLAFIMADVLNKIGSTIGVDFSDFTPWIGWYTLATLAINELRSILENLVEYGIDVPPFLIKGLQVATKALQMKENMFDGAIHLTDSTGDGDSYKIELHASAEELKDRDTITLKIHKSDDE